MREPEKRPRYSKLETQRLGSRLLLLRQSVDILATGQIPDQFENELHGRRPLVPDNEDR